MKPDAEEQAVLKAIRSLADEEHRLYSHEAISDAGRNPEEAHLRPPEIVENYEQ